MADSEQPRFRVNTFPSDDADFRATVRDALEAMPRPDVAELQRVIRERYPLATVSVRSPLATPAAGGEVWYAFRRATAAGVAERWWDGLDTWAIVAADRTFIEATDTFAAIVELPAAELIGKRIEDFVNPADPTASQDIVELWAELDDRGVADGSLRFNRMDGTPRELEYHFEPEGAEVGRYRVVIRERAEPAGPG
jgi:PAS domain-containing protein